MGSLTRRIKRNIMENICGFRVCTEKGFRKKVQALEQEVAAKTKNTLSGKNTEVATNTCPK